MLMRRQYANYYKPGDHNCICDRTGFKVKRSNARKEWNNLIVRRESWEPRQPQDFVRGKKDQPGVRDARPRPADYFLSTNEVSPSDL